MNKYTVIGVHSGGEVYYECVEAETPVAAMGNAFNAKEEAAPEAIYAVIQGHHKEVGLSELGYVYPVNENDAGDL